jgi:hypothetical protein
MTLFIRLFHSLWTLGTKKKLGRRKIWSLGIKEKYYFSYLAKLLIFSEIL